MSVLTAVAAGSPSAESNVVAGESARQVAACGSPATSERRRG